MSMFIPDSPNERVVIVGAGFAGLHLARKLAKQSFQVVLLDKNNYHQFQPLFYQVAMAGLEPSSIVFPLRKLFQKNKNVFIRMAEVQSVKADQKILQTSIGELPYDKLILAMGATTNFFGNKKLESMALPMKTVGEALCIRNSILEDYESSILTGDYDDRQGLIDIVVVGGGPTGVEVCGALAEMKRYVLPKDFKELNSSEVDIHLIQSSPVLLKGMSAKASKAAYDFLTDLDVHVKLNTRVTDFDGDYVYMNDGSRIRCQKLIWAAGIRANQIEGIPEVSTGSGGRLKVDAYNQITGMTDVYAIGDMAIMESEATPYGHPQVAQVAIQQADNLAKNLKATRRGKLMKAFVYKDRGALATIGRHRAVADLPAMKIKGAFAWFIWLFVHLFKILGSKNKLFVFINWMWNYFTYDQSLRLIIRPTRRPKKKDLNP
ncbi:MAG: NAD(P)/FAD-dependent oxidoreductase [Bacteroidetes bacterium]|nr:NAD(P)/FAD-dependent oxidoreductase [Bacteroidota bacterium]